MFFFQAEDGIRDIGVTGVQDVCSSDLISETLRKDFEKRGINVMTGTKADPGSLEKTDSGVKIKIASADAGEKEETEGERSEERRVGKECRSRRSPYH